MLDKHHYTNKDNTSLSRDIQAYVKKRAATQEVTATAARKHLEVQLLLSELENLLLHMDQDDLQVLAVRKKLFDLKIAFYKTLDIT
jgi:hypothetical protein